MKKSRLQELAGIKEYETQFQQAGAGISTNRDSKPGDREVQLNKAFLTDDGFGDKPNHTRGIQPATAQQIKKQYQTLDKALIAMRSLLDNAYDELEEHHVEESAVIAALMMEMDLFKAMDDIIESSFLPKVKM
jgi:hypothetical protein|tara:strand:+ start:2668 stop:3066 length:399 start_codon:yes stop_codon:yes gene_type:complete